MEIRKLPEDLVPLSLARELKQAGLAWHPRDHDAFMVPDRDLDDTVFVITNMAIRVQRMQGYPTIAFQGAYEWALDYIFLDEVVWMPSESQLRSEVERRLRAGQTPALRLTRARGGYVCEIDDRGHYLTFSGANASTAYAQALLHLLQQGRRLDVAPDVA